MPTIRVATAQYRVSNDVQSNLDKLLSMIDRAAAGGAQLLVTPEFGNHTAFYADAEYARKVAIEPDGDYVKAVAARAKQHQLYVVFNATTRAGDALRLRNYLVGPDGEVIGSGDKQVLMGGEREHIGGSTTEGAVFETPIGRIGLYSCLDGVFCETSRCLAIQGAQILCNTLNSCALDEPGTHIPMRAMENRVWVVASGKAGPIVVDEMIQPLCDMVGIQPHLLEGHAESPVVGPDGRVRVKGAQYAEDLVFADIDPGEADNKRWDDGDLMADRVPAAYAPLAAAPVSIGEESDAPAAFEAAVVQLRSDRAFDRNLLRALDLVRDAAEVGNKLIVLPERFSQPLALAAEDTKSALAQSNEVASKLDALAREHKVFIATSLVAEDDGLRHSTVLWGPDGEVGRAHQVHLTDTDKRWAKPGDSFKVFDTAIGRIGLMTGYDSLFCESANVLGVLGADIVVHPTSWRQEWEVDYAQPERAAECHMSVLSASRMDNTVGRGSLAIPASDSRPIGAGDLNPIWPVEAPRARETLLRVRIDPALSRRKDLLGMDVLQGRAPALYAPLAK